MTVMRMLKLVDESELTLCILAQWRRTVEKRAIEKSVKSVNDDTVQHLPTVSLGEMMCHPVEWPGSRRAAQAVLHRTGDCN